MEQGNMVAGATNNRVEQIEKKLLHLDKAICLIESTLSGFGETLREKQPSLDNPERAQPSFIGIWHDLPSRLQLAIERIESIDADLQNIIY
jgi:hypothetical protein